jgi:hypothetical protein
MHNKPAPDSLQPFDRPTDPAGTLFVHSDASLDNLLATGLARGEQLRAWLEMMECSNSELTYQPKDIAAMLAPTLADLLMLVRTAHNKLHAGAQAQEVPSSSRRQGHLYMIDSTEASGG